MTPDRPRSQTSSRGPASRVMLAVALAAVLAVLALAVYLATKPLRPGPAAPHDVHTVPAVTIRGQTWRVELAMTGPQRYHGLSGRGEIPPGTGMLFIYPRPQVLQFCMRLCPNPIDIAFIGPDQTVLQTYTMAVEPDLGESTLYSSVQPAQYALEVAGGALGRAGVGVGDKVEFSAVPPAAKADDGP